MKDLEQMTLLLDFYGPLLTVRQLALMQAYYLEDLSLAEIADGDGVSRQAVHDLIKRSEASLLECEEKLGFINEYQARQEQLTRLEAALLEGDREAGLAILRGLKGQ